MTTISASTEAPQTDITWTRVCTIDQVPRDRGVAVLVDGVAVALFRVHSVHTNTDSWFAVDHLDPATGAPVMARGLIGSVTEDDRTLTVVASPLHKERYDLASGRCLDSTDHQLSTHPVRVVDAAVEIGCQTLSSDT